MESIFLISVVCIILFYGGSQGNLSVINEQVYTGDLDSGIFNTGSAFTGSGKVYMEYYATGIGNI